jgi:membrane fusion protein, multidrug efflux system
MKNLAFLFIVAFLVACQPETDETKKAQIIKYKDQITALKQNIKELEGSMNTDSLSSDSHKVPVRIESIKAKSFNHFFEVNGKIEAVNDAFVSPEMNGQVNKVHVKEGQKVKKGTLLVSLNTAVTESSLKELQTGLELASKIFDKQQTVYDQGVGSEIQYLEAKNAKESLELKIKTVKAQLAMSSIRAPFDGIVDEIFVKVGEMAAPGLRVLELVDLTDLVLVADVSESHLSQLSKADLVEVSFPAYPEMNGVFPISRIGNVVNVENRTFKVEIKIKNQDEKLKPNLLAVLKLNDYSNEAALVVPSIILKQDIKGYFMYVVEGMQKNMTARKVYVEPGISYQTMSTVEKGISEGDRVIIEGYNMLTDGSAIKTD